MHKLFLIVVLALKGVTTTQAQDFFPLQVGNIWRYEVWFTGQFYGYETHQIVQDTVMPNGKRYYKDTGLGQWVRLDTLLNSFHYDGFNRDDDTTTSELVMDKFLVATSESWISYKNSNGGWATMEGTYVSNVFNEAVEVKVISYRSPSGLWIRTEHHSRKHGLIYYAVEPSVSYKLIGAKIDGKIYGDVTSVLPTPQLLPTAFVVKEPYPNPFNSSTIIEYELSTEVFITIKVYNVLGDVVRNLEEGIKQPGSYRIQWDLLGNNHYELPSGVYFVCFETPERSIIKKIIALR